MIINWRSSRYRGGSRMLSGAAVVAAVSVGVVVAQAAPSRFLTIELELNAVRTDVSDDVNAANGFHLRYGTWGNGPKDLVGETGRAEFYLKNHTGNEGGIQGWYSPNHPNRRSGFTYGIGVWVTFSDGAEVKIWRGKLGVIDPAPGAYRTQLTHCIAFDAMDDLATQDVRDIPPQLNKSEAELMHAVLDAMPVAAQPPARDIDAGLDVYTYAFDRLGKGVKARTAVQQIANSSRSYVNVICDDTTGGVFRMENRHTRAMAVSQWTFDDDDIQVFRAPSDLQNVFNRVRTIIHPKALGETDATRLFQTAMPIRVTPGHPVEFWGEYTDPDDPTQKVGGTDFHDPLDPDEGDYAANSTSDFTGTDLTDDITVTAEFFASTVKLTIESSGTQPAFVTLAPRGRPIRDLAPMTLESVSVQSYGDRLVEIDMPFQDDPEIAQGVADMERTLRQAPEHQVDAVGFSPSVSSAYMTRMLRTEPGVKFTVGETVTGISAVDVVTQGIEIHVHPDNWVTCLVAVAPAELSDAFILDDEDRGVLDEDRLSYA